MTDADLAPITAFQLDIVGPFNGETAKISPGLGTITYTSGVGLTAAASEPSCVDWDYSALEQANTFYEQLSAAEDTQLSHYFGITSAPAAAAVHRAKVAHKLRIPK